MEITSHNVKTIFVAPCTKGDTYWFNVIVVDEDGVSAEITLFGKNKMPEVVFGEPE